MRWRSKVRSSPVEVTSVHHEVAGVTVLWFWFTEAAAGFACSLFVFVLCDRLHTGSRFDQGVCALVAAAQGGEVERRDAVRVDRVHSGS